MTGIVDFIGMLVALFAVLYSFGIIFGRGRRRPNNEEPTELDSEIEGYLKELEEEEEPIEEVLPPVAPPAAPPPVPREKHFLEGQKEKFAFRATLEGYKPQSPIEERQLAIGIGEEGDLVSERLRPFGEEGTILKREKRVPAVLRAFPDKKMLVVAAEIIRPPLALRLRKERF